MVTFKLKADESKSKYWKLTLPALYESRTDNVLQKLKLDSSSMEDNCYVAGVESDLPLQYLAGQKINLHEATTLFQQLENLSESELNRFSAIISAHKPDLKNMIKISVNMHCFEVYDYHDHGELIKENLNSLPSFRTNGDMLLNKTAENNIRSFAVSKLSSAMWEIQNALMPGLLKENLERVNSMKKTLINAIEELRQNISSDGFGREVISKNNIAIGSELIIADDHINAYLSAQFDADKRFGLNTADTDEYIDLYADYYPEDCGLDVYYIHRSPDGEEIAVKSVDDLTIDEMKVIFQLMRDAELYKLIAEMRDEQESGMSMQ